jgi:hypothetical protein
MNNVNNFDKNCWPIKKISAKKIEVLKIKKCFYKPYFFQRKVFFVFDSLKFKFIKKWYLDNVLEDFTIRLHMKFFFISLNRITTQFFFFIISLYIKKKIIFHKKDEVILFGPYSHNYAHIIHEFLNRIIYIKNYTNFKKITVPDYLKRVLSSSVFVKSLKNIRIRYLKSNQNYIIYNVNYLTHIENRFSNFYLRDTFNKLRDIVQNNVEKNNKNCLVLVSRMESSRRRLINEQELFDKLKIFGFKKFYFEKLSVNQQIKIASNCKVMIGYHGAGISNCVYMKKNTHVIEIFNKNYIHSHFKLFSKIQKINYKNFICTKNLPNLDGLCDSGRIVKYIKNIL